LHFASEIARADFNNDGIEDILVTNATEGSYRTYDTEIYTRLTKDKPFSKVKIKL